MDLTKALTSATVNSKFLREVKLNLTQHIDGVDDEIEEPLNENGNICLSLCFTASKLGACYFDEETQKLHLLEDCDQSLENCYFVESLIHQVRPSVVICNAKQDYRLLYNLKRFCHHEGSVDDVSTTVTEEENNTFKPKLVLLHSKAFEIQNSRFTINDLFAKNADENIGDIEKRLKANFTINFDCVNLVRSLGALIKYRNLTNIVECHTDQRSEGDSLSNRSCTVFGISHFTLDKIVIVDQTTLLALQVFCPRFHPSLYKYGQGGCKEGLSLYSLCNRCCSNPGSRELKKWFHRPYFDRAILDKRSETIGFLSEDTNAELVQAMRKSLKSIKYITRILVRMQLMQASVANWFTLYKTIYHCLHLSELIALRQNKPRLFHDFEKYFNAKLRQVAYLMGRVIDFETMHTEGRFCVREEVDSELDERKRIYRDLSGVMNDFVRREVSNLPISFAQCCMVYIPIVGYLLMVPLDDALSSRKFGSAVNANNIETSGSGENGSNLDLSASDLEKPGLEFIFTSDGYAYYKSAGCHQLDQEYGDIKLSIVDRETTVMIRLQNVILESATTLLDAVNACAQLDCLISLAITAREFNWIRPTIIESEGSDGIFIENGRHPLMELCTAQFVPNSTRSSSSQTDNAAKVHLLTGPNASGKSIYLKQIGVIMYLIHIGSFVPATKATVTLLDRIFTRMHTIDSVLDGMSTFAVDVRQVSLSFAEATRKSLVIIDEFGKGTLTEVGLALLQSCLESWLSKNSNCPHLFISTHFYSLLWTLKEHPLLKYETMETVRRGMEFIFLYQLVDGFIDCAYATQVANEAGLPDKIISRSYEIYNHYKNRERILRPDQTDESYSMEFQKNENLVNDFLLSIDESEFYENFIVKFKCGEEQINRDASSTTLKVDL